MKNMFQLGFGIYLLEFLTNVRHLLTYTILQAGLQFSFFNFVEI